jgi:hypothetical protein
MDGSHAGAEDADANAFERRDADAIDFVPHSIRLDEPLRHDANFGPILPAGAGMIADRRICTRAGLGISQWQPRVSPFCLHDGTYKTVGTYETPIEENPIRYFI